MIPFNSYLKTVEWSSVINLVGQKCLALVSLALACWLLKKLIHAIAHRFIWKSLRVTQQDINRQQTLASLLTNSLDYLLYFFTGYWALAILGVPISSLLAGAGLAGLAFGLGAQGFLTDVINGFFILLERQYDVGDRVTINTISGTVKQIGIRTTQILDKDGTLHTLPNRQVTLVSNRSLQAIRLQVDLPISLETDVAQLRQAVLAIHDKEQHFLRQHSLTPDIKGACLNPLSHLVFRVEFWARLDQHDSIYFHFFPKYQQALTKIKTDD
ncbi:mechanosensitive ion channel family protein [Streptococcus sp. sy004]|uniref:mechanosensitive ion channel family protein n=1 Tax=Streptococcus sp. sy004 TaxID=2600149 RepID=UPI0011B692C3|nr:mechanosensitive ion channel family protein [Streptococcus sp. sy004]TWT10973.1 mechanosensitive ion channel family protein [Streptococcus sp. sy004]